jgi:hypothetical protein
MAVITSAQNRYSSLSNEPGGATDPSAGGPDFYFSLPNPIGIGNCVILGLSYAYNAARTVAIKDYATIDDAKANVNILDTWSGTPEATVNDAGLALTTSIFRLKNAKGGGQAFRITFDNPVYSVQFVCDEWYNVDIAAAVDTTWTNNADSLPSVSGGSAKTPGVAGCLIWHIGVDVSSISTSNAGVSGTLTKMTAGTNFTRRVAEYNVGQFVQISIQGSATSVNPTLTTTGTSTDAYNSVAIAIRPAMAGTPPPANTIRIASVAAIRNTNSTTYTSGFPTEGNLIIYETTSDGPSISKIQDSLNAKPFTMFANGIDSVFSYLLNPPSVGPTMDITITLSSGSNMGLLIDVVNCAGFDNFFILNSYTEPYGNADIPDAIQINPVTPNGLVLGIAAFGQGPPSGPIGPGEIFDNVWYAGMGDAGAGFNTGDGHMHKYNTTAVPVSLGMHVTQIPPLAATTVNAIAVAFIGPVPESLGGRAPSTVIPTYNKMPRQQRM